MNESAYSQHLHEQCDPEQITSLSKTVFIEGHLELIDDLIVAVLPLAHIIYHKYIKYLDDDEYAKEDLISDAILRLYQDMTLRWDKYIHVDSYYEYYAMILRNGMIGLVHEYHGYYAHSDVDIESLAHNEYIDSAYHRVELKIMRSTIVDSIMDTARHLLSCRRVNTNLLMKIFDCKYSGIGKLESLRNQARIIGISPELFTSYCGHVDYIYKLSYHYQHAILGGRNIMIDRITKTINRFEDVTYQLLSVKYYDGIIPEIYAELGPHAAKNFVKVFSNKTVTVPDYRDFCDDLLGGAVVSLANGDKSNLYELADNYHIPYKSLARIYNKAIATEEKGGMI